MTHVRQFPATADGKRPKGGRSRTARLSVRVQPHHLRLLDALAEADGVNRTVALERAIELAAARTLIPQDD